MSRFFGIFMVALTLSSPAALASNDGIEAAERLCRGLLYSDRINECLREVRDARHFDTAAVAVCGGLLYHDRITSCLRTIRDRQYTATAVAACRGQLYADRIIECFESSGRRARPEENVDRAFVTGNLRQALRALRDGETRRAERLIETVLDGLNR